MEGVFTSLMYEAVINKYRPSQNPVELNKLFKYIGDIQAKNFLVIGVENGDLLRIIKEAFTPEILIGLDSHEKELPQELATFIYGDTISPETYDKVVDLITNKSIDLLILNHDKTFEGLRKEYFLYKDLVRKGGIIAMDSIRLKSPQFHLAGIDVSDFWHNLIRDNTINYYEFWDVGVNGYGPGIGMMYK